MSVEWLTITELAAWLHLRERRIMALVRTEAIPYVKIGRQVRFDREAIHRWMEATAHPATDTATPVVTKGIPMVPEVTDGSPIRLVRGPNGRHRARLKEGGANSN